MKFGKKKSEKIEDKDKKEELPKDEVKKSKRRKLSEEKEQNDITTEDPGFAIMLQNFTLYSVFRKLLLVFIFCVITTVIAIFGIMSYTTEDVEARYLMVNEKAHLLREYHTNSRGEIKDGEIISNAVEVVKILNNYDYKNWKEQIIRAEKYFTPSDWADFSKNFFASGTTKTVENEQSIVSVDFTEEPKIISNEKDTNPDKIFTWKVSLPVTVTYYPHDKTKRVQPLRQKGTVELFYKRVLVDENPRQYSIYRYRFNTSK